MEHERDGRQLDQANLTEVQCRKNERPRRSSARERIWCMKGCLDLSDEGGDVLQLPPAFSPCSCQDSHKKPLSQTVSAHCMARRRLQHDPYPDCGYWVLDDFGRGCHIVCIDKMSGGVHRSSGCKIRTSLSMSLLGSGSGRVFQYAPFLELHCTLSSDMAMQIASFLPSQASDSMLIYMYDSEDRA